MALSMTGSKKKLPLNREFYSQNVKTVARQLLGKRLISTIGGRTTAGIVVETEAYRATSDSACHGTRGITPRNEVMFGDPGFAYVYPIHARVCFNAVTQSAGFAAAVLIRAIEVCEGIDVMFGRRQVDRELDLARGPARLCQALGIDRKVDSLDLTVGKSVWFDEHQSRVIRESQVKRTVRIGVTSAKELKLRYVVAGSKSASGPLRLR